MIISKYLRNRNKHARLQYCTVYLILNVLDTDLILNVIDTVILSFLELIIFEIDPRLILFY